MLWEGHMKKTYDILFSNDIVQKACDTYSHNFDHEALCCDVKELGSSLLPEADVVIGDFPCQDYAEEIVIPKFKPQPIKIEGLRVKTSG